MPPTTAFHSPGTSPEFYGLDEEQHATDSKLDSHSDPVGCTASTNSILLANLLGSPRALVTQVRTLATRLDTR